MKQIKTLGFRILMRLFGSALLLLSVLPLSAAAEIVEDSANNIYYYVYPEEGYASVGGLISKDNETTLNISESVTYDNQRYKVTEIEPSAFLNCRVLTGSLTIPNSVTKIGGYAFDGCSGFTGSLTIPNSVTEIGWCTFYGCRGLTGPLVIGRSVLQISELAFKDVTPSFIVLLPENAPDGLSYLPTSGTVYVPAESLEDYKKQLGSNRTILPLGISIDIENKVMKPGETIQLTPVIVPTGLPNNTLTWTSSDPSVATVDETGLVKGIAHGKVTITVTTAYGFETSQEIFVGDLSLESTQIILAVGESETIVPNIVPAELAQKAIVWTSSNNNVANVNKNGVVTAVKEGVATITATLDNEISASATVYVANIEMKKETVLGMGGSETLEAIILPKELADRKIVWSSSDDMCVKVDQFGNLTVVGFGSAVITAALADYPNVKATCTVKVSGDASTVLVESITLDPDTWSGPVGSTFDIVATVSPANADDKSLNWSSSDVSVATVDSSGRVSIVGEGSCSITARANDGSDVSAICQILTESGIESIYNDNAAEMVIYTLQGVRLQISSADDIKRLTPGIYIINGNKTIIK
ncbi:MAG: Ig-like domain-containing protein [Muribaculaceae bacterium]|nr:Ig-like domain-containing protein [Muribaculaceae bacterium]